MKRNAIAACVLLCAMGLLAGCTTEDYARMFLKREVPFGSKERHYLFVPSTEKLKADKTISDGRLLKMPDEVDIDVWIINAKTAAKARGTVLILHDLNDTKNSYRSLANLLAGKGFDVVMTDLRAHGRSGGKYITYGAKEKLDQKRVMDELIAEKLVADRIYVFGAGLGAAVGLQYAAIDPRVKGVMALAAFRDIRSTFEKYINDIAMIMSPEDRQETLARAAKIGEFRLADASALTAIAQLKCPVLLMHGLADIRTPHTESEALYKAAGGPKELELVPLLRRLGLLFAPDASLVERIEKVVSGKLSPTAPPTTKPAAK